MADLSQAKLWKMRFEVVWSAHILLIWKWLKFLFIWKFSIVKGNNKILLFKQKKIWFSSELLNFIIWNWNALEKLFFHFCRCQRIWSTRFVNFRYATTCISFLNAFTISKYLKIIFARPYALLRVSQYDALFFIYLVVDAELEKLKQKSRMDNMVLILDGIFLYSAHVCKKIYNWYHGTHVRIHSEIVQTWGVISIIWSV